MGSKADRIEANRAARMKAAGQAIDADDLAAIPALFQDVDLGEGHPVFQVIAKVLDRDKAQHLGAIAPLAQRLPKHQRQICDCLTRHFQGDAQARTELLAIGAQDQRLARSARLWAMYLDLPRMQDLPKRALAAPPAIFQFWDDPDAIPDDVAPLLDQWRAIAGPNYKLFDKHSAADWLRDHFGPREAGLLLAAPHPAIMCDYFRLGYVAVAGGVYVDADSEARPAVRPMLGRLQGHTLLCFQTHTPWLNISTGFLVADPGSALMHAAFAEATKRMAEQPDLDVLRLAGPIMMSDVTARLHADGALQDSLVTVTNPAMRRWLQRQVKTGYKADKSDQRHWTHWQKQKRGQKG